MAEDAAMDSAPAGSSREDLVRIRRKGLIEFEISRCPDAPNREIAQACRTSISAVSAIREESVEPPAGRPDERRFGSSG